MNGHVRALTDEAAKDMKERIWEGDTATDVSKMFGLSTLTISRIRSGVAYEDVPWPDGTTGGLPSYRVQVLSGMRRRNTVADKKYNGVVESMYDEDVADFDWYKFYCAGIGMPDNEFNRNMLDKKARIAGYADLPTMGKARAPKLLKLMQDEDDRKTTAWHEEKQRKYTEAEKHYVPVKVEEQRQDIVDPGPAAKRDWDEIVTMKPDLLEVLMVEADPDNNEALKLATQIVLRPAKDAHDAVVRLKHWDDQQTHILIDNIKQKILAWQEEQTAL